MHPLAAFYGTAVLAGLLYLPGSAVARALRLEADLFARVWCGLAAVSGVGLWLALAGRFSLLGVCGALAALSLAALPFGLRRRNHVRPVEAPSGDASERTAAQQRVRTVFEAEYPDIRAMHLHPKDIGGAIVSVDQPHPAAAWRWGGPHWRMQPGRRGAQQVLGATIEARDPVVMAKRWQEVLDLEEPVAVGAAWRLPLREGSIDFVPAAARGEGLCGYTLAVADRAAVLQAARAHAQEVEGDTVTMFGTRVELRDLPAT